MFRPQPCARRAHWHLLTEQHSTIVGRIYPIQIHISDHVQAPNLCPKGTLTPPNWTTLHNCWQNISNMVILGASWLLMSFATSHKHITTHKVTTSQTTLKFPCVCSSPKLPSILTSHISGGDIQLRFMKSCSTKYVHKEQLLVESVLVQMCDKTIRTFMVQMCNLVLIIKYLAVISSNLTFIKRQVIAAFILQVRYLSSVWSLSLSLSLSLS